MSCYHPLFRIAADDIPFNEPSALFLRRRLYNGGTVLDKITYDSLPLSLSEKFVRIPCGKCIGCRLDYSRQWADRIMLESMLYPEDTSFFLTLTYDEDHVPRPLLRYPNFLSDSEIETFEPVYFPTLVKKDLQKFFKLVRTNYKRRYGVELNLRYFACGEFGDKTHRPHYHVCVMNLPLRDLRVSQTFCQKRDGRKIGVLYESDFLNSCWIDGRGGKQRGGIAIGRLTWSSAAYVARYIMKKQKGKSAKQRVSDDPVCGYSFFETESYSQVSNSVFQDEFVCMSRKPGLAYQYFQDHFGDIVISDSVPILTKSGVQMHKMPRYFDSKLKERFPELLDDLKAERRAVAISGRLMELERISLSEDEFLQQQEAIKMRSLSRLVRPID